MFRPRPLLLFSVVLFYCAFGDSEKVGKSEITDEDFKKEGNSRKDAEQDPFTSVTLAAEAGDAQSTLFSTCLAKSRTIEARFASIEVVPGSEYIRYVPDARQLAFPISWTSVTGNYSSILDCAQAAHGGGWPMFKYNGSKCQVVNSTFSLADVPKCEETNSDAVFILSSASTATVCPMPRFLIGYDDGAKAVCGLVNTDLLTYDEAKSFCAGVYPNKEFTLFVNEYPPLTLQNATNKFTALGYTKTNLWVDANEQPITRAIGWYGNFLLTDWWNGQLPAVSGPNDAMRAAYLDKDSSFKLRASDKSFKAGALCSTHAVSSTDG